MVNNSLNLILTCGIFTGIFGIFVGGVQLGSLSLILLKLLLLPVELAPLLPNFGTKRLCSVMNASNFCFPPRT